MYVCVCVGSGATAHRYRGGAHRSRRRALVQPARGRVIKQYREGRGKGKRTSTRRNIPLGGRRRRRERDMSSERESACGIRARAERPCMIIGRAGLARASSIGFPVIDVLLLFIHRLLRLGLEETK